MIEPIFFDPCEQLDVFNFEFSVIYDKWNLFRIYWELHCSQNFDDFPHLQLLSSLTILIFYFVVGVMTDIVFLINLGEGGGLTKEEEYEFSFT